MSSLLLNKLPILANIASKIIIFTMDTRINKPHFAITISGMSISGMATAIEALSAGLSVLIINKHDDRFTLDRRILLSSDARAYLTSLMPYSPASHSADEKFLTKLSRNVTISLKKIQAYLYRRLCEHNKASLSLQIKLFSSLSHVDLNNGQASFENLKNKTRHHFTFDMLIGADGVHRRALTLTNMNVLPIERIELLTLGKQEKTHVFAEIAITSSEKISTLKENYVYSMGHHYGPAALLSKSEKKYAKNYIYSLKFLSPLVNDIVNESQASAFILSSSYEILRRHGIFLTTDAIGVCHSRIVNHIPKDVSPRFFTSQPKQCQKAYINKNHHIFVAIGDCYRSSEYSVGHGANDALFHAQLLGGYFKGIISLSAYSTEVAQRAQRVTITKYNQLREPDEVLKATANYQRKLTQSFPN